MTPIKKILISLFFLLFLSYWIITITFSFPESSVVVAENYHAYKKFQTVFYQKWSFFAPPPTYNMRLHYIFKSKAGIHDVEVLENINNKVKEKYLLNDTYANASWLLFANVDNIIQSMGKLHNSFKNIDPNLSKATDSSDSSEYNYVRQALQNTGSMQILIHYANTIAKEMNLHEGYKVQVLISRIDIIKYGDRNKLNINKGKEKIMFASNFYIYKDKSWENLQ